MQPDARLAARDALARLAAGDWSPLAADWRGRASHPWGEVAAPAPWAALRNAMPDLERRDTILLAGENRPDARWTAPRAPRLVATLGSYLGTFRAPLAGIEPTGGVATVDYGEAHWVERGRIRASWLVWDLAGLMIRSGQWRRPRGTGAPGHWPAPATGDGLRLAPDPDERGRSLARVLEMHAALHRFDGTDIESMDMSHWAPDFGYWAAGAIGACRGLQGFRQHHQVPFLRAFPDRVGAGHFVRLSDGPYAVTGGDVALTHTGAPYWGVEPSGRQLRFRVMDFYRFDRDGRIAENWLPNDTLGLLAQMGVEVLARAA